MVMIAYDPPSEKSKEEFKRHVMQNSHIIWACEVEQFGHIMEDKAEKKKNNLLKKGWTESGLREITEMAGNYGSALLDTKLWLKLIKDLGFKAKLRVNDYGGKPYVILTGNARLRKIFTGTRYGAMNPKVVTMGLGQYGIKNTARSGGILSVILMSGFRVLDYLLKDEATLAELIGSLATDVVKVAVSTGVAWALTAATAATVASVLAVGPLLVFIVVGLVVNKILNSIDEKYHITNQLIKGLDALAILSKNKALQGKEKILDMKQLAEDAMKNARTLPHRTLNAAIELMLDSVEDYIIHSAENLLRRLTFNPGY